MALQEEAKIELTLVAQKYLAGIKQVEGQTDKSEKAMEKAFTKLARDAEGASAKYALLGNKSQKVAQEQKAVERAIDTLIKNGFSKTSPQVQALISDYRNLGKASDSVVQKTTGVKGAIAGFAKQALGAYAGIAGIRKVIDYAGESINEFIESEKAFNKLNAAFVASGDTSGVAARSIQKMAEELQSLTNVSEEEIQSAGGLLRSIAGLDKNGIEKILPRIIDMSAALGIDLETATKQVAQTLAGGRNTLAKYGIEIDKNATLSERLATVTDGLNKKFAGTASQLANVIDGIKIEASELKEAIGGALMFRFDTLADYYREGLRVIADTIKKGTKESQFDTIVESLLGGESFEAVNKRLTGIGETWMNVLAELYGKQAELEDKVNNPESEGFAPTASNRKALASLKGKIEAVNAYAKAIKVWSDADAQAAKKAAEAAVALEERQKRLAISYAIDKIAIAASEERARIYDEQNTLIEETNSGLTKEQLLLIKISELNAAADDNAIPLYDEKIDKVKELTDAEQARLSMQKELVGGFTSLMTDTVDAMANGEDAGKAFFKSLVSNIGDAVIAYAGLVEAQGWATFPIVDWLKVAKGVGLAVTGSAIKASAYAMANGGEGTVTKPTLFLAGVS